MCVLPDDSLPSVWREANGLHRLNPEQTLSATWGDRQQNFWWVNDIEYSYGPNDRPRRLHVVVCEERWTTRDREGKETEHHARFACFMPAP